MKDGKCVSPYFIFAGFVYRCQENKEPPIINFDEQDLTKYLNNLKKESIFSNSIEPSEIISFMREIGVLTDNPREVSCKLPENLANRLKHLENPDIIGDYIDSFSNQFKYKI